MLGTGPQHPFDFGDLGVEPCPLGLQALDGGGEDFGTEVWFRHVSRGVEIWLPGPGTFLLSVARGW